MLRMPILHGKFYDADPAVLRRKIGIDLTPQPQSLPDELAQAVPEAQRMPWPCEPVRARAVLLPHAGHVYCGRIMGQTLARCTLPRRLVLLCPNHTGQGDPLAVWTDGSWRTPLGDVPVDAELAAALLDSGTGYTADVTAHAGEHSLEVILPYLQVHSPESMVTPVRVSCRPDDLHTAGMALAGVIRQCADKGEEVGIVISSDLNHYAPEAENHTRDALAVRLFLNMDPVELFNTINRERVSMCGVFPATLALFALKALELTMPVPVARLAAYTTSAEVSGDASAVVGYAGVVVS